ncbi:hypothetical protein BO78DRAFT_391759 [Aspergillus sclerotiicarbonarius CBS 121057]|uniref:Uncharacterized protein n=1 Tax=Aspergillus sclerotiicarbonarius (strain CBS 121057 / IBT 28362) TaxID=1448318 RepID=A0A319EAC5_ASPSB|nr:hypothetical protein BO78DRAFT_391759 [Aspergillus sclerotiicarbonarius CBS 121057]
MKTEEEDDSSIKPDILKSPITTTSPMQLVLNTETQTETKPIKKRPASPSPLSSPRAPKRTTTTTTSTTTTTTTSNVPTSLLTSLKTLVNQLETTPTNPPSSTTTTTTNEPWTSTALHLLQLSETLYDTNINLSMDLVLEIGEIRTRAMSITEELNAVVQKLGRLIGCCVELETRMCDLSEKEPVACEGIRGVVRALMDANKGDVEGGRVVREALGGLNGLGVGGLGGEKREE